MRKLWQSEDNIFLCQFHEYHYVFLYKYAMRALYLFYNPIDHVPIIEDVRIKILQVAVT